MILGFLFGTKSFLLLMLFTHPAKKNLRTPMGYYLPTGYFIATIRIYDLNIFSCYDYDWKKSVEGANLKKCL